VLGLQLLPFEIEDAEKAARLWEHTRTKDRLSVTAPAWPPPTGWASPP
jgi:hypothetical protein